MHLVGDQGASEVMCRLVRFGGVEFVREVDCSRSQREQHFADFAPGEAQNDFVGLDVAHWPAPLSHTQWLNPCGVLYAR